MQVPHGGDFHAGRPRPWPQPPHRAPPSALQGLPGPLPSRPGSAGGEFHCPVCSWSPQHHEVFTCSRCRGSCEVFQGVTFLPANFLGLLDIEDPRAGWVPLRPRGSPITSFRFKWPIVQRDKATATLSMVTKLFFGNSYQGSALTVPLWAVGTAWPQGLWNGAQNHSDTFHFKSGAQINYQHNCFRI